jgi:hypothetical protein
MVGGEAPERADDGRSSRLRPFGEDAEKVVGDRSRPTGAQARERLAASSATQRLRSAREVLRIEQAWQAFEAAADRVDLPLVAARSNSAERSALLSWPNAAGCLHARKAPETEMLPHAKKQGADAGRPARPMGRRAPSNRSAAMQGGSRVSRVKKREKGVSS